jgi:putative NADPH-quinone reductase
MDLVVFAHPREDSLCGQALKRVTAAKPDTAVTDLYRDSFSPVLTDADLAAYGRPPADPLVARYQREVRAATTVTFVFPVWMYGLPAILKGYFDRVWTPGVTFAFRDNGPAGLLMQLKTIRVVCTFGQAQAFYGTGGDPIRLFFEQLISQNCAPDCKVDYVPLFGTDKLDAAAVEGFLDRAARVAA